MDIHITVTVKNHKVMPVPLTVPEKQIPAVFRIMPRPVLPCDLNRWRRRMFDVFKPYVQAFQQRIQFRISIHFSGIYSVPATKIIFFLKKRNHIRLMSGHRYQGLPPPPGKPPPAPDEPITVTSDDTVKVESEDPPVQVAPLYNP
jgi:hypothetical protein